MEFIDEIIMKRRIRYYTTVINYIIADYDTSAE